MLQAHGDYFESKQIELNLGMVRQLAQSTSGKEPP